MAIPQQKFREVVFQLLYGIDLGQSTEEDMLPLLMAELSVTKQVVRSAQIRVRAILSHLPEIDQLIGQSSNSYDFDRIQSVERNILRLGIFELLFDEEIPPKVAIAEAMRLARKFSSPESAQFINAILDNIYQSNKK